MKRRHLLQLFASAIATLGMSQWEFEHKAFHYAKALSQETSRKRALLVGINQYLDPKWIQLNGAVNDTLLQKELLVHRFGFEPGSIRVLTENEATCENILQAFEEHLIQWAQPGDAVVFHFSGHGSQVADPDKVFSDGRVSTIVPINSTLPAGYPNISGTVNDITGHTLWLLMQSLNTGNVTYVLDSCHSGGARNGSLTVRSRPGDQELLRVSDPSIQLLASKKEQEYQEQLLTRLKLSRSEFARQRKLGVPKGIMLSAARRDQLAIDAPFAGTPAGIFTYVLTRYLWQQTSSVPANLVIASTIAMTQRILQEYYPNVAVIQQPESNIRQGSDRDKQAVYFISQKSVPAEAVITKVQGDQVDLFLGGIDPRTLEAFGKGATFTLPNGQGQVRVESRDQFTAKGVLSQPQARGTITSGTLLQEVSRAIPSDLTLRIGLDPSLGQESESAREALKAINKRMEPVSIQQQDLHYILGRVTKEYVQRLQKLNFKELPEIGSVALFSPAADLIPDSAGSAEERAADAVTNRLKAKLKSLLAARLVKLTLNASSTKLSVAAAMETVDGGAIQAEAFTVRGATVAPLSQSRGLATRSSNAQRITPGTEVKFLIQNNELRDLYVTLLLISVDGELTVLSPLPGNGDAPPIPAGKQVQVPDPDRGELYRFKIAGDPGVAEALVIFSTTPLKQAIALLQTLAAETGHTRGTPMALNREPDMAISSLLDDLDKGNRGRGTVSLPGVRQIDTRQMATMSIVFEIRSHDSKK
jgi:Caspase domain/Domain of unknown function (DUF4384)